MALDPNIELGLGAQRLQTAMDMLNTISGQPVGLGGRPAIFMTGTTAMTQAQIVTATGLTAAQVADLAGRAGRG
jgi:hypothetical protein